MKTDWKGEAYDSSCHKNSYMRQELSIGVGELLYGTGEQFGPFVKNGQSIDIWNEDGGTSNRPVIQKYSVLYFKQRIWNIRKPYR